MPGLFCCCKPSNTVIFLDVDHTIIDGDSKLNRNLLEALRGKEVVFLTNMNMREVSEKVADPRYVDRKALIEQLRSEYNIKVLHVVTPVDLDNSLKPGEGYKKYIAPQIVRAVNRKLEAANLTTDDEFLRVKKEFNEKFNPHMERNMPEPKGGLAEKYFELNPNIERVYFFDDKPECIAAVQAACEKANIACVCARVDMKDGCSKDDYLQILATTPQVPVTSYQTHLTESDPLVGAADTAKQTVAMYL